MSICLKHLHEPNKSEPKWLQLKVSVTQTARTAAAAASYYLWEFFIATTKAIAKWLLRLAVLITTDTTWTYNYYKDY